MTATGPCGKAALSSAGVSIRPRNAGTPSTSKKCPLTNAPSTGTTRPPCARSKVSRDQAKAPSNRSVERAPISCHTGYDHDPSLSSARLPGSRTGSGRMMRLLKIENSAVLAPIPSASVPITTAEKPALLRNPRPAARTSWRTPSSTRIAHTSRASSTASMTLPMARRLACAASSRPRPSRCNAACRSVRCVSISSRKSAS